MTKHVASFPTLAIVRRDLYQNRGSSKLVVVYLLVPYECHIERPYIARFFGFSLVPFGGRRKHKHKALALALAISIYICSIPVEKVFF